jgi:alkanesulfonate monooxygenase SsuD/methylene tetrahydromethanopterin reductase-like flavin-dependent oxidoreductase (luciferase family)
LALSAGALSNLTDGRFILGIGSGSVHSPDYRRTWGLRKRSSLALMRAYLETIRGFVAGQSVTYDGAGMRYQNARLAIEPAPRTPVFLGALGPEMLRLGGELADGLCLSWATSPQVAWSRERIAEGAQRAGRDPAAVQVASYVRVCVDDDIEVARRAFTHALLHYALGWPGATGRPVYRLHFERMGFAAEIADLIKMRESGAPESAIIDAFPAAMLDQVGYYGPATGAAAAFLRHAEGADIAIVRVVAARPGIASMLAVMEACRPALVAA